MGVHIVLRKNGVDLPAWDWIRQGHDREFAGMIAGRYDAHMGYEEFRPDLEALRRDVEATEWEPQWKARAIHFIRLLEQDPNVSVHLSN
jgi:hypothetical protein